MNIATKPDGLIPLGLTRSQRAILATIAGRKADTGRAPRLQEVGDVVGMGRSGVLYHLVQLRTMGFVDWEDKLVGTLTLTDLALGYLEVVSLARTNYRPFPESAS